MIMKWGWVFPAWTLPAPAADGVLAAPAAGWISERVSRGPGNRALDQGAGHPRPDGMAEEEPIVELSATTTTPPGGCGNTRARQSCCRGLLAVLLGEADERLADRLRGQLRLPRP